MKVLIYDCETTGLPSSRVVSKTWLWPNIVQLSWMVYDTACNKIVNIEDHVILLPKGFGISTESSDIHGITTAIMLEKGTHLRPVIDKFMDDARKSHMLIAHNDEFDSKVIQVEQIRHRYNKRNMINALRKIKYCTMKNGTNVCNIENINRYTNKKQLKYPKLSELHGKLFNSIPNNLHNSMVDILVCFRCFGKLYFDIDYLEYNTEIKKLWDKFTV
jgi:DNA polymerase-3 subunit epsilon